MIRWLYLLYRSYNWHLFQFLPLLLGALRLFQQYAFRGACAGYSLRRSDCLLEATSWPLAIPTQHPCVQTSPAPRRRPLLVQICDGQEDLRTSYFDYFERQFQGKFKQLPHNFTQKFG